MTLRLVPNTPAQACQMKTISDKSVFHSERIVHCHRFGQWGIIDGNFIEYRACSQHLHQVLTILYSEDVGPFSVLPLRELPETM
jgi:hypothetical protein